MKRLLIGLMVGAMAAIGFGGVGAFAASSNWKVGSYNASGQALSMASVGAGSGMATFNFTNQPNTALLVTTQGALKGDLLGNLTGETITAAFTVADVSPTATFIYGGGFCGSTTSYVRLFFQTDNGGGFAYTHYWWSNPIQVTLGNGGGQLKADLTDPTLWSDWNGQFAITEPAGFSDAVANVTTIGLSFGGGCFFENGVGTTDGSGSFTLTSFTVG